MNELRCAIASLQAHEDGAYPTKQAMEHTATELARETETNFQEWLSSLPMDIQRDAENHTVMMASAWADKAYERGYIAGARMMVQLLMR